MINRDVLFWIEFTNWGHILANIREKDIFIWGAYSKGASLCDELNKKGIDVSGFLDAFKYDRQYKGKNVFHPDKINVKNKKPYIFIAVDSVKREILSWLSENGYHENIDYIYFAKSTPFVEISSLRGEYKDTFNNVFVYDGIQELKNVRILCTGGNNYVSLGKSLSSLNSNGILTIKVGYGSVVKIGDNTTINGNALFDAECGGKIIVGEGFSMSDDVQLSSRNDGYIEIDDKVSVGRRLFLTSGARSPVKIGFDCMISGDVTILGTNGHSIIDLEQKNSISILKEKPIIINNHVWIGKKATILYDTEIGAGCIVGASSLVKGSFPEKSIIAGNIARVIKKNCTWDRRRDVEYEDMQSL